MSVNDAKRLLDVGLQLSAGRIFLFGMQEVFTSHLAELSLEVAAGNMTFEAAEKKVIELLSTITFGLIKGGKT